MRGDPRVYTVRITMLEEYEAWVIAPVRDITLPLRDARGRPARLLMWDSAGR